MHMISGKFNGDWSDFSIRNSPNITVYSVRKSDQFSTFLNISSPVMMPILEFEVHHSSNGSVVGSYFQVYRKDHACRTSTCIMLFFKLCTAIKL